MARQTAIGVFRRAWRGVATRAILRGIGLSLVLLPHAVLAQTAIVDVLRVSPGRQGTLRVWLRSDDADVGVGAVQLDLRLPQAKVWIGAKTSGRPDCAVDPGLERPQSIFSYLPSGCRVAEPGSCRGVRVLIFGLMDAEEIPDGAALFTCVLTVGADAPIGPQLIRLENSVMSSLSGLRLPAADTTDGLLLIENPPGSTPTRTASPSPTPTPSPTSSPSSMVCAGDCDGNGEVSVNELLLLINRVLGMAPDDLCRAGDLDKDGKITVDEVLIALNRALSGCWGW